jgi:hypothetical protein
MAQMGETQGKGKWRGTWGLSKIMVPETCPYAALSRTFRGTWDYDQVFDYYHCGIQTFREPYAALSRPFATAAKHTHPYLQMSLGY